MVRLLAPRLTDRSPLTAAGGAVPLLPSPFFTPGGMLSPDLLFFHTTEGKEIRRSARNTCSWFQNPAARVSCLFVVDDLEILQCIARPDFDAAWHVGALNSFSIGIEIAGNAAQSAEEWADAYSLSALANAVEVAAWSCLRFRIPPTAVSAEQIAQNRPGWRLRRFPVPFRGLSTHGAVTEALGIIGGHTDPGPNFPLASVVARVAARVVELSS